MRQSVFDIFPKFSDVLEGHVEHMYLDILGLVTIGRGCLIDPLSLAMGLPFVHRSDNTPATRQEIEAEWHLIKDNTRLKSMHYNYAGKLCKLKLTAEGIDALMARRMRVFEDYLKKAFPEWDDWPADAQLAAMSMAWAMGAGYVKIFKNLVEAANKHSWLVAAECCKIREEGNPGIIPRNRANKILFGISALAYGPTDTGYDKTKVSEGAIDFLWHLHQQT